MFGVNLTKPIQAAPICHICGAKPSENHVKGCVWLSCLRTSAYPQILDDNGREWRDNLIDNLQRENELLRKAQPSNNSETTEDGI